ncbi:9414_t:CDS:2 [Diversispora eburnea]|uniref:9414_t:CDS:1 n=1 Tax=Diversispora eburnea TaxID=1213867 RepID=A0A9N8Z7H2_9GLOM|nr:9414_t:CDS:2 [Diversispora eburnea]
MVFPTKDNSNSNVGPVPSILPPGRIPSNGSIYAVLDFFSISLPRVTLYSFAYMLIVVAICVLALAFVHKHVAKPSWRPSSQQLSEKVRLYMARSMIGDATRKMFNGWSRSRQDNSTISNRDEKSRRLSPDTSSSSSTSLSPSVLPTHTASPRLYKKTSNSRLASQRRSNSRPKSQPQISSISTIDDNSSDNSSNNSSNDQLLEQPSTSTELDESKITVTINVADALNSQVEQTVNVNSHSQESNCKIENNHLDANLENVSSTTNNKQNHPEQVLTSDHIDSWNNSCQNSISNQDEKDRRVALDIMAPSLSLPPQNLSPILRKKNSKSLLKGKRRQNSRQNDQNGCEDQSRHNIIDLNSSETQIIQKDNQESSQNETSVKSGHKRRRKRAKNSKNNNQQTLRRDQRIEQKSSKQDSVTDQELTQHNVNRLSKSISSNSSDDTIGSISYPLWQKSLRDQQAKATLSEVNDKNANMFQRSDSPWKHNGLSSSSHIETDIQSINQPIVSVNKFTSYADIILPTENKIATPAPTASVRKSTNHQWYSPFGSGLSIQLNTPSLPRDNYNQLESSTNSISLFSSDSSPVMPERSRSTIVPPSPISVPNNRHSSTSSMFSSSSPFSNLSQSSMSNKNPSNSTCISPTASSLRGSFFGRKHPVSDKEKGELDGINREKLNENKSQATTWYESRRSQQPQFSLFDKRLSFMYPPKS